MPDERNAEVLYHLMSLLYVLVKSTVFCTLALLDILFCVQIEKQIENHFHVLMLCLMRASVYLCSALSAHK